MIKNKIVINENDWVELDKVPIGGKDKFSHYYSIALKSKNSNEIMPVIILTGTMLEKVKILGDFMKDLENINYRSIIAIYSGNLDSELKRMAKNTNINLCKELIITSNDIKKVITVKDEKDIKINNKKIMKKNDHRRERIYIIKEILELITEYENVNITKIVYKCNLNYEYAINIIEDLIEKGFVSLDEDQNSIKYSITTKGIEYLITLRNI